MKKILLFVLLTTLGISSYSTTWTVTNSGMTFTPFSITIMNGDNVNFILESIHNVVEVSLDTWNANESTPLPGFSTPFGGGLVTPAHLTTGSHYYVCAPHASSGMKGIIIVETSAGIQDISSNVNFSIYPNPSNGRFTLQINNSQVSKAYTLNIFNFQGEKVYSSIYYTQQNSNQIDLADIPKGIYFIRLQNGSELLNKKIIIL